MFGSVGGGEIILLLVLALLLFGPRKLPKIGRTIGSALSEFRKATTEFRSNLEREVDLTDLNEARRDISDAVHEVRGVARNSVLGAAKQAIDPAAERRPQRSSEDAATAAEPDPGVRHPQAPGSETAESPPAPADGKATDERQP
jgi:sec-independent protein translocase protein TatB